MKIIIRDKTSRYAIIAFSVFTLIAANMFLNAKSLELSDNALFYESQIKELRKANLSLESKLTKSSSLAYIADMAKAAGYEPGGRFVVMRTRELASR